MDMVSEVKVSIIKHCFKSIWDLSEEAKNLCQVKSNTKTETILKYVDKIGCYVDTIDGLATSPKNSDAAKTEWLAEGRWDYWAIDDNGEEE